MNQQQVYDFVVAHARAQGKPDVTGAPPTTPPLLTKKGYALASALFDEIGEMPAMPPGTAHDPFEILYDTLTEVIEPYEAKYFPANPIIGVDFTVDIKVKPVFGDPQ